ncbi:MAG: MerC domain-containing protein [Candidatus Poribacteria bacterium]|nr:MerC domain-containing protein [Candidatus Poribacteria bacterium]
MKGHLSHSTIDNIGACLSFACAAHCMAAPLLITVLPLMGLGFILAESTELVMVASAGAIAVGSLTWGFRSHRKRRVFLILGGALMLIVIARLGVSENAEVVFTVLGGLLLMGAHLVNRHLCRTCQPCETVDN